MKIKVCIMFAFLSVLLFFSSFSVKAANDVVFPAFPEPVEGKSSTHYVIIYDVWGDYTLLKPLDPTTICVENISPQKDVIRFGGSPYISYKWREGTNSWRQTGEHDGSGYREINENKTILYSSFNLYYTDGSVFFRRAPIKASFLTQMKQVKMGATLATLVSLIPLLIGLVVSFLAFRKGLVWLLKVLRKA